MSKTILVTGCDLPPPAIDLLKGYAIVYAGRAPAENDLIALMQQHDPVGIIVRYGKITANVIGAGKRLKAISKYGSGIDTIDVLAAKQKGIAVCAAVGANAPSVAEHTIALILACAKSIPKMNARMHAGHWDKATHKSIELKGRTLGLIGLGAIGRNVAKIAAAMDMDVIGYDPYAKDLPGAIRSVSLEALWTESDVLSFHCPLTPETRNLLNAHTLESVKPGLIVVNTARGGLIDEAALLSAIQNGTIACAGLDSFQQEPPSPDHPFFGEERIVLSPHIGGVSVEAYLNVGIASTTNLLAQLGS